MTEFICPNCNKLGYIATLVNEADYIPKSKIEARIKKLESLLSWIVANNRNGKFLTDNKYMTDCEIQDRIEELKELLK